MDENDIFDIANVPLGEGPPNEQFNQWDEKARLRRLNIEFVDLTEHPQFLESINNIKSKIELERTRLGFDSMKDDWPEVRFVDSSYWNEVAISAGMIDHVGGFYDRKSNVAFLKTNKKTFGTNAEQTIYDLYTVAHEFCHSAMPIDSYSFHLSEAIVDSIAKESLDKQNARKKIIDEFVNGPDAEYKGSKLTPGDIIAMRKAGKIHVSPYILQARMLRLVKAKMGDEDYDELLRMSFSGDIEGIKSSLKTHLGDEVEKMLNDPKGLNNIVEIQKAIE